MEKNNIIINIDGRQPYIIKFDEDGATALEDLIIAGKEELILDITNLLIQFLKISLSNIELMNNSIVSNSLISGTDRSLSTIQLIYEFILHSKM